MPFMEQSPESLAAGGSCPAPTNAVTAFRRGRACPARGEPTRTKRVRSGTAALFLTWTIALFTSPYQWANEDSPEALLHARGAEFDKAVLEVTEGVYTAVGYTIAPVSMIVGDGGLIIVDTGVDVPSAREVRADFRNISDAPIRAVILTHGHTDHSGGLAVFLEDGTEVWAGPDFGAENRFAMDVGLTINLQRGLAQFGYALPPEDHINMGIGKYYVPREMGEGEQRRENLAGAAGAEPDHTLAPFERRTITVAGIELKLVANPAETTDAIYVWVPEKKVLFSGDTFYKSWPNLAPFRGIRYRDIQDYVRSIDALVNENAQFLVSGHNRPISGERVIRETLINYRDAIQYLFDKSIEGMNAGLTREELVAEVKLPDKYANLDYLRPYYGHPDWAVRGIYNHFLGWFDGNPTSLFPLSPSEEARRMIELAGGEERLTNEIRRAMQDNDHQWAAQLCDYLLAIQPENNEVKSIKADALEALAENRLTTTARNYYRTVAQELRREAAVSTQD